MKKGIHPEMKKCTIKCACGASFETLSNKEEHTMETCNLCHPFYTNKAGAHKKTGAVEKFNKKYNIKD
ncbi:MAG: 50S ribosomal protein L31 [Bacilli bacterium]|nr:50S ribosomal protein L31 [Bacilli bacterium]